MPSDLTERLAAKLGTWLDGVLVTHLNDYGEYVLSPAAIARESDKLLPLLLSEPELVAGLAPEVKREVLTPRERAVMKLGEAALNPGVSLDNVAGYFTDIQQFLAALAEARALAPSPAPLEGTNDDR